MLSESLQKKVDFAIKLLQQAEKKAAEVGQPVEIAYSGGKDSDVILELAKMAGINYRAIYKNTSIDPPGTIKHCKEKGAEIRKPVKTFLQLVREKGTPTRRARFCCEVLKEYKVLDYAVIGVRRYESTARAKRYKEPEICRVTAKGEVRQYLPLLDWTDKDIVDFIADRKIKCHPLYYDEQGNFHVERRLGCIGCPLSSSKQKEDYKKYPKLLKQVIKSMQVCIDDHPQRGVAKKFNNSAYDVIYHNLFTKSYQEYVEKLQPDLWGNTLNCKEYLEKYFGISLDLD